MNTIFLSGTIKDMKKEREVFHNIILPGLNRILSNYGSSVSLCDLRWGADNQDKGEEESTIKILDVCFDLLRSTSPFFVVMLGDRYGLIPDEENCKKAEENGIKYHRQSVTEMEIEYYNIQKSSKAKSVIYLFRQPIPVDKMTEESRKIYAAESEEHRLKLEKLKEKIRRENPGRVFSYSVQWDEVRQEYSLEEFIELVGEKLKIELSEFLGSLPIMTGEEKTINESKAYFEKRVNLCAENEEITEMLFKDMLCQISGKDNKISEELKEIYRKSGRFGFGDKWEPFKALLVRKEGEESTLIADVYIKSLEKELSKKVIYVPFVAGINENAFSGQHLLDCIVRALEIRFLQDEKTLWKNGSDMRQKAMRLIDFKPFGRYPVSSLEGRRYYLECLLNYATAKGYCVFLFVQDFERFMDTFARELQFLTATGDGNESVYMFLEMTDKYMKNMSYIHGCEGNHIYKLKSIKNTQTDNSKIEKMIDYVGGLNSILSKFILKMLAITEYGVSKKLIEDVAVNIGVKWSELDFEVFVNKFSGDIKCSQEGLYSFYNLAFKDAVFEASKPVKLLDMYTGYLKTLTSEDEEFFTECIRVAIRQKDADRVWEILNCMTDSQINNLNIICLILKGIEDGGTWLVENVSHKPLEKAVIWFGKDFYKWMKHQGRTSELILVIKMLSEAEWCPLVCKMLCHSYISEYYDKGGKHSFATREFEKAFEIAEKVRSEYPVETLKVISNYTYLSFLYQRENMEFYAKLAYSRAIELSLNEDSFLTVVYACYDWLRVFESNQPIKVINDRYQHIFELFYKMGNTVCFDYDKKYKRNFFDKVKIKYIQVCMEICDSYATFLENNYKNADGINVPCYMVVSTDGELKSVKEEADFATASLVYRNYAIDMAKIKYSDTHNAGILEFYGNCVYRQGNFMVEMGRNDDACKFFELSVSAYHNILKAYSRESDVARIKLCCADAYLGIGKDCYHKAYELYNGVDLKYFSQKQVEKFSECCMKLSTGENGEFYRKQALEIMSHIEKSSYSLYYDYYQFYKVKTEGLLKKSVNELTEEDMTTMSITAMLLANCFFCGADSKQAEILYAENKSVIQSVAGYLNGMQDADTVIGVYKYIRGFYFEYCCRMAEGKKDIAYSNKETYKKELELKLSARQVNACLNAPSPEKVIDYVRHLPELKG